ncbi:RidA family protein [Microbacterium sp. LWH3-1.2]|uniref:RidA family protein n=1 Tax=Microbacterium sp. LWH3-1.2 TaxID=3135256 RepID=UPI0039C8E7CC
MAATPGYAYASVIPARASVVHLAGACPLDADGTIVPVGDFAGQATKCIENMLVALDAAGATISDIAYTRVLVASSKNDDLGMVWAVVRDAFAGHEVPSTLFGVAALGFENQLVEIEAVAGIAE